MVEDDTQEKGEALKIDTLLGFQDRLQISVNNCKEGSKQREESWQVGRRG